MKRAITVFLTTSLAMAGSGCATVTSDSTRSAAPYAAVPTGFVEVSVFDDDGSARAHAVSERPVSWELSREERGRVERVHESSAPRFALRDLPPGKYRWTLRQWTDEKGSAHSADKDESFRLAAGQTVAVSAVLRNRRRVPIIAAGAGGGALVVSIVLYTLARAVTFH